MMMHVRALCISYNCLLKGIFHLIADATFTVAELAFWYNPERPNLRYHKRFQYIFLLVPAIFAKVTRGRVKFIDARAPYLSETLLFELQPRLEKSFFSDPQY